MEKKTIGGFIAALRKANGMTQKDLADRLNVSDKTVSRWERDDGTPDLSAIPVIAEIFGITCDELLRGERKSPSERMESQEENAPTPKGEKQLQRLLKSTLSQYESRTYIAMGISAVGLTAAMIGNLAFLRAVLGFLLGAIFFIVSIVCQGVFVRQAFFRVEDAEIDKTELSAFKRRVIGLAERSLGLTVGMIGFTFPLILADAYVGLSLDNLLLFAIPGAALFLAIFVIVCYFLNASFLKKGIYSLSPKDKAIYSEDGPVIYDEQQSLEDRKAAYIANDIGITYTFPNEIYTVDIGGQTYYVMEVNATAQDGEYTEYFVVRRQGDYMIVLHFYGKTRTLDDYLAMVS